MEPDKGWNNPEDTLEMVQDARMDGQVLDLSVTDRLEATAQAGLQAFSYDVHVKLGMELLALRRQEALMKLDAEAFGEKLKRRAMIRNVLKQVAKDENWVQYPASDMDRINKVMASRAGQEDEEGNEDEEDGRAGGAKARVKDPSAAYAKWLERKRRKAPGGAAFGTTTARDLWLYSGIPKEERMTASGEPGSSTTSRSGESRGGSSYSFGKAQRGLAAPGSAHRAGRAQATASGQQRSMLGEEGRALGVTDYATFATGEPDSDAEGDEPAPDEALEGAAELLGLGGGEGQAKRMLTGAKSTKVLIEAAKAALEDECLSAPSQATTWRDALRAKSLMPPVGIKVGPGGSLYDIEELAEGSATLAGAARELPSTEAWVAELEAAAAGVAAVTDEQLNTFVQAVQAAVAANQASSAEAAATAAAAAAAKAPAASGSRPVTPQAAATAAAAAKAASAKAAAAAASVMMYGEAAAAVESVVAAAEKRLTQASTAYASAHESKLAAILGLQSKEAEVQYLRDWRAAAEHERLAAVAAALQLQRARLDRVAEGGAAAASPAMTRLMRQCSDTATLLQELPAGIDKAEAEAAAREEEREKRRSALRLIEDECVRLAEEMTAKGETERLASLMEAEAEAERLMAAAENDEDLRKHAIMAAILMGVEEWVMEKEARQAALRVAERDALRLGVLAGREEAKHAAAEKAGEPQPDRSLMDELKELHENASEEVIMRRKLLEEAIAELQHFEEMRREQLERQALAEAMVLAAAAAGADARITCAAQNAEGGIDHVDRLDALTPERVDLVFDGVLAALSECSAAGGAAETDLERCSREAAARMEAARKVLEAVRVIRTMQAGTSAELAAMREAEARLGAVRRGVREEQQRLEGLVQAEADAARLAWLQGVLEECSRLYGMLDAMAPEGAEGGAGGDGASEQEALDALLDAAVRAMAGCRQSAEAGGGEQGGLQQCSQEAAERVAAARALLGKVAGLWAAQGAAAAAARPAEHWVAVRQAVREERQRLEGLVQAEADEARQAWLQGVLEECSRLYDALQAVAPEPQEAQEQQQQQQQQQQQPSLADLLQAAVAAVESYCHTEEEAQGGGGATHGSPAADGSAAPGGELGAPASGLEACSQQAAQRVAAARALLEQVRVLRASQAGTRAELSALSAEAQQLSAARKAVQEEQRRLAALVQAETDASRQAWLQSVLDECNRLYDTLYTLAPPTEPGTDAPAACVDSSQLLREGCDDFAPPHEAVPALPPVPPLAQQPPEPSPRRAQVDATTPRRALSPLVQPAEEPSPSRMNLAAVQSRYRRSEASGAAQLSSPNRTQARGPGPAAAPTTVTLGFDLSSGSAYSELQRGNGSVTRAGGSHGAGGQHAAQLGPMPHHAPHALHAPRHGMHGKPHPSTLLSPLQTNGLGATGGPDAGFAYHHPHSPGTGVPGGANMNSPMLNPAAGLLAGQRRQQAPATHARAHGAHCDPLLPPIERNHSGDPSSPVRPGSAGSQGPGSPGAARAGGAGGGLAGQLSHLHPPPDSPMSIHSVHQQHGHAPEAPGDAHHPGGPERSAGSVLRVAGGGTLIAHAGAASTAGGGCPSLVSRSGGSVTAGGTNPKPRPHAAVQSLMLSAESSVPSIPIGAVGGRGLHPQSGPQAPAGPNRRASQPGGSVAASMAGGGGGGGAAPCAPISVPTLLLGDMTYTQWVAQHDTSSRALEAARQVDDVLAKLPTELHMVLLNAAELLSGLGADAIPQTRDAAASHQLHNLPPAVSRYITSQLQRIYGQRTSNSGAAAQGQGQGQTSPAGPLPTWVESPAAGLVAAPLRKSCNGAGGGAGGQPRVSASGLGGAASAGGEQLTTSALQILNSLLPGVASSMFAVKSSGARALGVQSSVNFEARGPSGDAFGGGFKGGALRSRKGGSAQLRSGPGTPSGDVGGLTGVGAGLGGSTLKRNTSGGRLAATRAEYEALKAQQEALGVERWTIRGVNVQHGPRQGEGKQQSPPSQQAAQRDPFLPPLVTKHTAAAVRQH